MVFINQESHGLIPWLSFIYDHPDESVIAGIPPLL